LERGNLAVLRNKFDEANEYFNKILFLDPFNTEAKNSIEKINIIRKNGLVSKGKGDFISYQNEKLQSADTLPEFDSEKLRDVISEESPPPPPVPEMTEESVKEQEPELPPFSPPPVPELKDEPITEQEPELLPSPPPPPPIPEMSKISEEDTDETAAGSLFPQKIPEQEMDETEIPPPISNMEEMDPPSNLAIEEPETPPIPEYEIPPIADVEKELEKIEESAQKEQQESASQRKQTAESFSMPETESQEKIQEQEPRLTVTPPPIPDVKDTADNPDIPEMPNETNQVLESQEPKKKMEEAEEPWQEEPGTEEPGFVTESAAELYVEQGLLDDALDIYKKLYDSRKEERFLSKIEDVKRIIVNQKKVRVLNELLKHIKQQGEKIV
jgi:hypothetical protein